MRPAFLVATLGGIGTVPHAPGTWAAMVVLPAVLLGPVWCFGLGVLLAVAGFWAVHVLEREGAAADPPWVVVDEGAGQLLALAGLPDGANAAGVALAFALFRALDILKPGPIGWLDRRRGPAFVMLDDLAAGATAGLGLFLFNRLYPKALG